jgi:RND family efflux transporter MFP subunit
MSPSFKIRWTRRATFVAALVLVATSHGCDQAPPPAASQAAPVAAKAVAVVEVNLAPWPETIRVQGSLLAFEDAVIGSKLAGRVDEVAVDRGSIVKRADPLVKLVRSELDLRVQLAEAQLRQACSTIGMTPADDERRFNALNAPGVKMEQALVTEAESNVNRARPLVASRAVTQGEFDTLLAQLGAAQARYQGALNLVGEQVSLIGVRRKELALAEQAVTDSQVVAPFGGVVGERRISPGEFVQAGQAVVTLVRADRLRFTAGVPESRAAAIRVGQQVDIELHGRNAPPLRAAISRISPTVMQSSRSILIEADVPNESLEMQAGLFTEAEIIVDPTAQAISVPKSAVSSFAGVQKVWMIVDGVAKQQTVRTGREANGLVEIVDGLPSGSLLVRNADEGHDGPVVAVDAESSSSLGSEHPADNAAGSKSSASGTL